MAIARPGGKAGPFAITIRQAGAKSVRLVPSAPIDSKNLDHAARVATHCLRLGEDLSEFHALIEKEAGDGSYDGAGGGRLLRSPTAYEDIVKSILGTNVAWSQAVKMIHSLCKLGVMEPATGIMLFPAPADILKAGGEWLRTEARVGYRADYVLELCHRLESGELDLSPVDRGELAGPELKKLFLSIKGVGKSTTHYLLMLHGDYSHLSIDSATRALMRQVTGRELKDEEIEKRYARWGRWKALALWREWFTSSGWVDKVAK